MTPPTRWVPSVPRGGSPPWHRGRRCARPARHEKRCAGDPTRGDFRSLVLVALVLVLAWPCAAALRVETEGLDPIVLREAPTEDTTGWYDVETWLRHLSGSVDWSPDDSRLVYREGGHWAALRAEPPYALRDGRPLEGVDPPRREAGRLLVSERFLRESGSRFVGRRVRVIREGVARRIVLDPGHGGDDVGSTGPDGVLEKDLVLELARSVAERLRSSGFEVYLTRSADHAIKPAQRAGVANYWEADLFLSLHASGSGRPQARGFEILVAPEPPAGAPSQLWAAGQAGKGAESRRWAEHLRAALGDAVPTFDRGVGVAPNPVLEAVACPASLVEGGSLAWPQEADLFRTQAGRSTLADAVTRAAEEYFASDL